MIIVRPATLEDAQFLADGNCALAMETENKALIPETVLQGVISALQQPHLGQYWIAQHSGVACGQLMVTQEWSDWRCGAMWWIQSVYILPNFRRRGVFGQLYQNTVTMAEQDQRCVGLRLYVEHENTAAQQTYRALGMQETGYLLYEWEKS